MGRCIILTGPSCVGKGPLVAGLEASRPDLAGRMRDFILYGDRAPRPGERDGVDYHFSTRAEIERLRGREGFVVMEVRGDLQAADLNEFRRLAAAGDVFFEGNPFVATLLLDAARAAGAATLSVFLSPLSHEELLDVRAQGSVFLERFVTEVMRRKLIVRTLKMKRRLTGADEAEIERRARSALAELRLACRFDVVLANHDGEGSDHWDVLGRPIGDARRAVTAFADLLDGRASPAAEKWTVGDPL